MQTANLTMAMVLLTVSMAGATQFRAFSRDAQVRGSDVILVGRVLSLRSDWDDAGKGIHTEAQIAIEEVWKGLPSGERIVVRTPGGSIDDVEYAVDGSARFREGETVLLFLEGQDGIYRPWGMTFGKYAVEGNRDGEFLVGNLPPSVSGAQAFEAVSVGLDDLRREVESILEGERR